MTVARTYAAVLLGVRAHIVEVEAHLSSGLPGLSIVGLPDTALNEARDRVRAAVVNCGLNWPQHRITVGLSPAWLPKRGSGLDVAIALAILAADGQVPADRVANMLALGELSLDGRIRPVPGSVAAALALSQSGVAEQLVVATQEADLLRQVREVFTLAATSLRGLVGQLTGVEVNDEPPIAVKQPSAVPTRLLDLADVRGHRFAKRGLEVAAVGGHHVLLIGRAGVGKTLLAERLPSICPDLNADGSLEVTATYQVADARSDEAISLIRRPPFVAPHHTASRVAIVGGGSEDRPTIGAVTRAHKGVLFLDEAAEFEPSALDALREPLESGVIRVTRAGFHLTFPAAFQLVMATNPCPCGNAMDGQMRARCLCSPGQRRKYLSRISGPLQDRIDVRLLIERPSAAELAAPAEPSSAVRERVATARTILHDRLRASGADTVASVTGDQLQQHWCLEQAAQRRLSNVGARESLRGMDRLLRLTWTIAAMAGREVPLSSDVEEAVELRSSAGVMAA